jgi:hypothetical protein
MFQGRGTFLKSLWEERGVVCDGDVEGYVRGERFRTRFSCVPKALPAGEYTIQASVRYRADVFPGEEFREDASVVIIWDPE